MATSESCFFFCDKPAADGASWTRKASAFWLGINVRKAAMKLEYQTLLAKLSSGDFIAQEAKYHRPCLLSLYNRARGTNTPEESGVDNMNNALAFAELVSYIENTRIDSTIIVAPIFKLNDLVHSYTTRQKLLGTAVTGRVQSASLNCGLPFELGKASGSSLHIRLPELLVLTNVWPCRYSMPTLIAIQCLFLEVGQKDCMGHLDHLWLRLTFILRPVFQDRSIDH